MNLEAILAKAAACRTLKTANNMPKNKSIPPREANGTNVPSESLRAHHFAIECLGKINLAHSFD
jgi:hypothetical protein